MGKDVDVFSGKASTNSLESLHGKVARVYEEGLISILEEHTEALRSAEQLAESEGEQFKKPKFKLSKEDIALLKGAQSFLKENDIQVDIVSSKGGKSLRNTISKFIES